MDRRFFEFVPDHRQRMWLWDFKLTCLLMVMMVPAKLLFHCGSVLSTDNTLCMISVARTMMKIIAWDDRRDQGRCSCHPWNLHCRPPHPILVSVRYMSSLKCTLYPHWVLHWTFSLISVYTYGITHLGLSILMHTVHCPSQYLLLGSFHKCLLLL